MIESGAKLRAARAGWLRVRARVRALTAKLAAAQHALERDARGSDDPQMAVLVEQLAAERGALEALGGEVEGRVRTVDAALRATEAASVNALASAARYGAPIAPTERRGQAAGVRR